MRNWLENAEWQTFHTKNDNNNNEKIKTSLDLEYVMFWKANKGSKGTILKRIKDILQIHARHLSEFELNWKKK